MNEVLEPCIFKAITPKLLGLRELVCIVSKPMNGSVYASQLLVCLVGENLGVILPRIYKCPKIGCLLYVCMCVRMFACVSVLVCVNLGDRSFVQIHYESYPKNHSEFISQHCLKNSICPIRQCTLLHLTHTPTPSLVTPQQETVFVFSILDDLTFFLVVILTFSVMVDTFGALRAEKNKKDFMLKNTCFICGKCEK